MSSGLKETRQSVVSTGLGLRGTSGAGADRLTVVEAGSPGQGAGVALAGLLLACGPSLTQMLPQGR